MFVIKNTVVPKIVKSTALAAYSEFKLYIGLVKYKNIRELPRPTIAVNNISSCDGQTGWMIQKSVGKGLSLFMAPQEDTSW